MGHYGESYFVVSFVANFVDNARDKAYDKVGPPLTVLTFDEHIN